MHLEKLDQFGNLEMSYISDFSGGYISKNEHILKYLDLTPFNQFILEKSVYGTPIFKVGGGGKKIMIVSGIHGNELPPQIANLYMINELLNKDLNNTVYLIPFAAPKSSMDNERTLNSLDLNRAAHIKNSVSNLIMQAIEELGVTAVGDFHSTSFNSNPGCESVFSSKSPTPESFLMANYISRDVGSEMLSFDFAGSMYKGALEDVCNLNGIPSITCEVLSPFGSVGKGTVETSFRQMKSFLSYFGI